MLQQELFSHFNNRRKQADTIDSLIWLTQRFLAAFHFKFYNHPVLSVHAVLTSLKPKSCAKNAV